MARSVPASDDRNRLSLLEGWVRATNEVTDVLGSARGLSEAASGLLHGIGGPLGCEGGTLWTLDPGGDRLTCHRAWGESATAPEGAGRQTTLERGAGLAGRAWSLLRPVWAQDLETGAAVDRGAAGTEASLAVAIPILYGATFYGVVELTRKAPWLATEADRVAAGGIGKQIGQFVAREESLRAHLRNRRELADLFENAPLGVHVLDREGRILRANRAELEMLGYSREEYVGRLWREFHVDPEVADSLLSDLSRDEPPAEVRRVDARLRCRDGSLKWVRVDANALHDEDGFVHVRAFTRDVTAGREAEIALRASEQRHRLLVEGARDYAIHALDREGRVTGWNGGAKRLYGWADAEILGRDFAVSFTEEDRADGAPARLLRLAVDEGEFHHEGWRARKDGSRFWAEVAYAALRDAAGALEGFSQLTRDASERRRKDALKRTSAELESANRAVMEAGQRASSLLRSLTAAVEGPMADIEAEAQRLAPFAGGGGGDASRHGILAAVTSLRRAVSDLADTAAQEGPAREGDAVPVDLFRLATDTRDMVRAAAVERRVRVEVDVDPSLVGVVADPRRIRQVLFNYLSNAIRFNREGGRVLVRILPEGDAQFRIEVEDSGIGISPEDVGRVFEGRAGAQPGAGLGLPATRRIVEQQGGRVGVQSTLGRGSVFLAVLPRVPVAGSPFGTAIEDEGGPRHALVVSAEPTTRASVAWTLGSLDFEAVSVPDADAALEIGRERAFDTVAVDLLLPGMGAIDLVAALRTAGASRDASTILAAIGTPDGAACLPVDALLARPTPAERLLPALVRAGVRRDPDASVLVVDGDLRVLDATQKTLAVLGYRARIEPDGHAALKACAEEEPAAVLLSAFPHGMDPFTFLLHLRQMPGRVQVPVFLTVPRPSENAQWRALDEAAQVVAKDRLWARCLPPAGKRRTPTTA